MKGAGLVGGVVYGTCQFHLYFNVQEVEWKRNLVAHGDAREEK